MADGVEDKNMIQLLLYLSLFSILILFNYTLLSYTTIQYVIGTVLLFSFLNTLEGIIMALLSKLVSPQLAKGTFNSGMYIYVNIYYSLYTIVYTRFFMNRIYVCVGVYSSVYILIHVHSFAFLSIYYTHIPISPYFPLNLGLLSTEAGTLGRVVGDMTITAFSSQFICTSIYTPTYTIYTLVNMLYAPIACGIIISIILVSVYSTKLHVEDNDD